MAEFFKKVGAVMRRMNITYHRRYDTEGSLCLGGDDASPKFSYALKGDYSISLGKVLAVFAGVATFLITTRALVTLLFKPRCKWFSFGRGRKNHRLSHNNKHKKLLKKKN